MNDTRFHSSQNDTVSLAHHHELIRSGISHVLSQADFDVIGEAGTIRELCHIAIQECPDVFLIDWELPDGGEEGIVSLREKFEDATIVVLTRKQPAKAITSAVQAGANGILSVDSSPDEFANSLRLILKGSLIISNDMANFIAEGLRATREQEDSALAALSDREREILTEIVRGSTNKEIANTLIITENTVKVHLRNILDKLNLRNRQQAAAFAVQEGLVEEVIAEADSQERESS